MSSPVYLTGVILEGIHGHQAVHQPLGEGLNIIFGKNGSGKTTFLHVLANLLERDIERFCHIKFDTIQIVTSEGSEIRLRQFAKMGMCSVEVAIDNRTIGQVERDQPVSDELDSALKERLSARPVYLPAFRSILEAAPSRRRPLSPAEREENEKELRSIVKRELRFEGTSRYSRPRGGFHASEKAETVAQKTVLCRRWFGSFVPVVRYPSITDIHTDLVLELEDAHFEIHRTDQRILSSVFVKVIESIVSDKVTGPADGELTDPKIIESSMKRVQTHLNALNPVQPTESDIYIQLSHLFDKTKSDVTPSETSLFARVLNVYEEALSERTVVQEQAYKRIKLFQQSVNHFLEGKSLALKFGPTTIARDPGPRIELANGESAGLGVLSSGERHVLSLLFSATHLRSTDGVLLIDEPELSLHVDWQRIILNELIQQAGERQVIACTHSPEVSADHITRLRKLSPKPWRGESNPIDEDLELAEDNET